MNGPLAAVRRLCTAPNVASIFLLGGLVFVFFELYTVHRTGETGSIAMTPATTSSLSRVSADSLARNIAAAHLFGAAAAEEARPAAYGAGDLSLKGTFVSEVVAMEGAIIAVAGQADGLFRVGEQLKGNLRLIAVAVDHVLLEDGSVRHRLEMPRQLIASLLGTAVSRGVRAAGPRPLGKRNAGLRVVSAQIAAEAGVQIVRGADGSVLGIRGAPVAKWAVKGLRADDVVTAIDGVPVDDYVRNPFAMNRFKQLKPLRIAATRDGEQFILTGSRKSPSALEIAKRQRANKQRQ
jgi:hypothetical protein